MKIRLFNVWGMDVFTLFQFGCAIGPKQIWVTICNFMLIIYLEE